MSYSTVALLGEYKTVEICRRETVPQRAVLKADRMSQTFEPCERRLRLHNKRLHHPLSIREDDQLVLMTRSCSGEAVDAPVRGECWKSAS